MDRVLGQLDERVSDMALKYFRERVWADALAYAAAIRQDEAHVLDERATAQQVVRNKLDWESHRIAKLLTDRSSWHRLLWLPEQAASTIRGLLGLKKSYRGIVLEVEGGVLVSGSKRPRD